MEKTFINASPECGIGKILHQNVNDGFYCKPRYEKICLLGFRPDQTNASHSSQLLKASGQSRHESEARTIAVQLKSTA